MLRQCWSGLSKDSPTGAYLASRRGQISSLQAGRRSHATESRLRPTGCWLPAGPIGQWLAGSGGARANPTVAGRAGEPLGAPNRGGRSSLSFQAWRLLPEHRP